MSELAFRKEDFMFLKWKVAGILQLKQTQRMDGALWLHLLDRKHNTFNVNMKGTKTIKGLKSLGYKLAQTQAERTAGN